MHRLYNQKERGGQGCSGPSPGPSTRAHAAGTVNLSENARDPGCGSPCHVPRGPETLTSFSLLNINNFRAEKYPQVAISGEEVGGRAGGNICED